MQSTRTEEVVLPRFSEGDLGDVTSWAIGYNAHGRGAWVWQSHHASCMSQLLASFNFHRAQPGPAGIYGWVISVRATQYSSDVFAFSWILSFLLLLLLLAIFSAPAAQR